MTLSYKNILKTIFTSVTTLSTFLPMAIFSENKPNPKILDNFTQPSLNNEEVKESATKKLEDILQRFGSNSTIANLFEIIKNTQGISLDNYLEWQDEFYLGGTGYIDGIRPERLQKSVMWGIDKWDRPYIAIKFTCQKDEINETPLAIAIFQRYSNSGETIATGGHFAGGSEFNIVFDANSDHRIFYNNLRTFLKEKSISSPFWYKEKQPFTLNLAK